jgi:hypothetical protein
LILATRERRRPACCTTRRGESSGQASKRRCRREALDTLGCGNGFDGRHLVGAPGLALGRSVALSMRISSALARLQLLPNCGNFVVAVAPVLGVAVPFALGERFLEICAKRVDVHMHPILRHGFPCIPSAAQHPKFALTASAAASRHATNEPRALERRIARLDIPSAVPAMEDCKHSLQRFSAKARTALDRAIPFVRLGCREA